MFWHMKWGVVRSKMINNELNHERFSLTFIFIWWKLIWKILTYNFKINIYSLWFDYYLMYIILTKKAQFLICRNTPSPRVTRFHVARNSSKPRFVEFHYNGIPQNCVMRNSNGIPSTVPLTRFSHNAEFRNSKNAR